MSQIQAMGKQVTGANGGTAGTNRDGRTGRFIFWTQDVLFFEIFKTFCDS